MGTQPAVRVALFVGQSTGSDDQGAGHRLLERDAENSYLSLDTADEGPMEHLLGSSITYRIAMGPQQGRKVFA
jgi:hypothetical protein